MNRRSILASVALFMLTACATGAAPTDIQFSGDSNKAIVVVGIEGFNEWRGMSAVLGFRGVDEAGAFDERSFRVSNGNGWREMQAAEYFVVEVEPGAYVASSTLTHDGIQNTITTFCLGTVWFDAPAG